MLGVDILGAELAVVWRGWLSFLLQDTSGAADAPHKIGYSPVARLGAFCAAVELHSSLRTP